jgi:Holliday junction resolvase
MRFVGSHPPIDVVASSGGKGKILCIQCKSGSSPFSGRDGAFLVQWANFFKGYPILVQRQRRKTFWYLLERGQFLPIEDAWLSELETIAV